MIGLAPGFFRSGGAVLDPAAIFGANLTAWYDSRVGVTDNGASPPRVIAWTDQSPAGGALVSPGDPPKYIANDVDGTPSVYFDPAEIRSLQFQAGFAVTPLQTVYMLIELAATNGIPDMALWSTAADVGLATRWTGGQVPSIFSAFATFTPPIAAVTGWAVIRWGGDNAGSFRSIAVNADAQTTAAGTWPAAGNDWLTLSRTVAADGANQQLRGTLKQFLATDTFVQDADPEHQQVLDYFKAVYPTLVTY